MLSSQQAKAVGHNGSLLVVAGAGSGKTFVVVGRIEYLLEKGIDPDDILAVTFTNEACRSMASRIGNRVLVKTFHSTGALILRESGHHIGYDTISICDDLDVKALIKASMERLSIKKELLEEIRAEISRVKGSLGVIDSRYEELFHHYQEQCLESKCVDFDDLILLSTKILKRFPDLHRWKYLLVDEFQDVNPAQYDMIKAFSANVFLVGDPDQSIYSWRGAVPFCDIEILKRDFHDLSMITLEENYRSTNNILKSANSLIAHNNRRFEKRLWSSLGEGEKVKIVSLGRDIDEGEFVVGEISKWDPNESAILYRTNFQSRLFEDALLRRKISYRIIRGVSFYRRKEVKDLISLMRIVVSPHDSVAFIRAISVPKRGIGKSTVAAILALKGNLIERCSEALDKIRLSSKQKVSLSLFINMINKSDSSNPYDLLNYLFVESGYQESLEGSLEKSNDNAPMENIKELLNKAKLFPGSAREFLEDIALHDVEESHSGVSLATLHNAKGLEFDRCFIVGLEEELLPHSNCMDDVEEERRLFYVGMTRAKNSLYITHVRKRYLWGSLKDQYPSRFLMELPKESTVILEKRSSVITTGEILDHADFGRGKVLKVYRTRFGITYDVYFFSLGEVHAITDNSKAFKSL